MSGEARMSLAVINTGQRRGTEIVQLYAADTAAGVTLPAQQLIGFARVDLEPGESQTVTFEVPETFTAPFSGVAAVIVGRVVSDGGWAVPTGVFMSVWISPCASARL